MLKLPFEKLVRDLKDTKEHVSTNNKIQTMIKEATSETVDLGNATIDDERGKIIIQSLLCNSIIVNLNFKPSKLLSEKTKSDIQNMLEYHKHIRYCFENNLKLPVEVASRNMEECQKMTATPGKPS